MGFYLEGFCAAYTFANWSDFSNFSISFRGIVYVQVKLERLNS